VADPTPVSLIDVTQTLHVLSAFWFVAGLIGRDVVLGQARDGDDIDRIASLVATAGPFERLMVIPGSIAVLVLGILTWWAEHLPLWGEGSRWVTVSLILFASTVPLVPLVFLPRGKVFEGALASAVSERRMTPELRAALLDPAVAAARTYEKVVVAVVIVLMVAKPF
jgi:Predicted integral membrane protein (DUF2269)